MLKIPIINAIVIVAKLKYWYFIPKILNFLNGTNIAKISCKGLHQRRLKFRDVQGCSEKNVRKKIREPIIPYIPNKSISIGL